MVKNLREKQHRASKLKFQQLLRGSRQKKRKKVSCLGGQQAAALGGAGDRLSRV